MNLHNLIAGQWQSSDQAERIEVIDPATSDVIATVPNSSAADVDAAVQHASAAFPAWRDTPVTERIQVLFRFKNLLEENLAELARTITSECGKTLAESTGELRRGIENVEVACGAPTLMQGYNNEDIARGIDEHMFRQPLGVVTAITPFNFPGMIPLWFLPYAIACGNCFILKPSEQTPWTAVRLVELLQQSGLPDGVVSVLHGRKETVQALIRHPDVRAVSFVGSTAVARSVYRDATAHGKRAQCQGGAKNPLVVLPDADVDMTTQIVADSAFGCAGQRCLAASTVITVGEAQSRFRDAFCQAAETRVVGNGLEDGVQMGPVISNASRQRIAALIEQGVTDGAALAVDGRRAQADGLNRGSFLCPTVLENVDPSSPLARTEVFGPVLTVLSVPDVDQAIELINQGEYGNMACLFTTSGAAARKFRHQVRAGNVGINLGVAAPMAFFPFSGWKQSFFGDLHAQGRHGVEFYTETKVVVERWPDQWTRQF